MIGAIAGDIVGSRFEGDPFPPKTFPLFDARCRFTDDTVCSLAIADAMMGKRDFANSLKGLVARYPDAGYGALFLSWALNRDAGPYGSWGNGAPMRVSAIGWLAASDVAAKDMAAEQASVSHNHPEAIAASQAVALAIFMLRKGSDIAAVRLRLETDFRYELRRETALVPRGFQVSAAATVVPALTCAFEADSWETAVRMAIGVGGDTDTLACIAGGVAEAAFGVPQSQAEKARSYLPADLAHILSGFDRHRRDTN